MFLLKYDAKYINDKVGKRFKQNGTRYKNLRGFKITETNCTGVYDLKEKKREPKTYHIGISSVYSHVRLFQMLINSTDIPCYYALTFRG